MSKSNKSKRYNDYYLINTDDMGEVDFDLPVPREKRSRMICCSITILCILLFVLFILVFVIVPVIFMNVKALQTTLIFTRFGLHNKEEYFETQRFPSYRNRYVTIRNNKTCEEKKLGVWHILPNNLALDEFYGRPIDYDELLLNSNYSVLIYFHGTGEDRADSKRKYKVFSQFFHVITFDYRGYGDSSKGNVSEENVIIDSIELYKWVQNRTKSAIYVSGHSLGASIATQTVAKMQNDSNISTKGLIIESGFTNLQDELYVHPISKFLSWLPWFSATILDPLRKNGFLFETDRFIATLNCPVMILHAEDDYEIPVKFGRKLYEIASNRNITTIYHEFEKKLEYGHTGIYADPFMNLYIQQFIDTTKPTVG
ncbi:unnamed protein product [Phyllotreta striolata]|uniref:Serine aminopeptidase S33 domain-containing protein n=1 Tax=Phyllotreta striolata TaxID=444603 RepID=A0A9N9TJB0_PHYSR|nr:unnamed protein product [Phyllotreta striolata]